jgi:hypothetical protein
MASARPEYGIGSKEAHLYSTYNAQPSREMSTSTEKIPDSGGPLWPGPKVSIMLNLQIEKPTPKLLLLVVSRTGETPLQATVPALWLFFSVCPQIPACLCFWLETQSNLESALPTTYRNQAWSSPPASSGRPHLSE